MRVQRNELFDPPGNIGGRMQTFTIPAQNSRGPGAATRHEWRRRRSWPHRKWPVAAHVLGQSSRRQLAPPQVAGRSARARAVKPKAAGPTAGGRSQRMCSGSQAEGSLPHRRWPVAAHVLGQSRRRQLAPPQVAGRSARARAVKPKAACPTAGGVRRRCRRDSGTARSAAGANCRPTRPRPEVSRPEAKRPRCR